MYSRNVGEKELSFGVSGMLYKANVLMYDHQSESLWSQVKNQAVTGPMTGTGLRVLPSTLTTWEKWRKKHPKTMVLSLKTGYARNYSRDPYADYYRSRRGMFGFFKELVSDYPGKELVAGVVLNGAAKAYPLAELRKTKRLSDTLGGQKLSFAFDSLTGELTIGDEAGTPVPFISAYWFVWKEIYPDSTLFKAQAQ